MQVLLHSLRSSAASSCSAAAAASGRAVHEKAGGQAQPRSSPQRGGRLAEGHCGSLGRPSPQEALCLVRLQGAAGCPFYCVTHRKSPSTASTAPSITHSSDALRRFSEHDIGFLVL